MALPAYDIMIDFSLNAKVYKNKIKKIYSEIHATTGKTKIYSLLLSCFLFKNYFNNMIKRDEFN